ncbi:YfcC family protein [uncultured Oscillibacter sp.]|uniref:YfcC family protein n=1 Tax=uncultured Oscillibacter sp. TaxID=876091 RepID=UPI002805C686|nr:YfcC family protein [uncultured Oscillibacter sp.]
MGKSKFRMPTAYTILFLLILLVAAATWVIPSGSYDYVDGIPQAGTYHAVPASPQGIGDVLKAAFSGFYDAVDVCVFILMVGGFLGVVMKTGAVDAGVASIIRLLGGREKWLIPILMLFFGLGGTTYGMWEETMAFYPLLIPVFLAAGYDAVVGISVILLRAIQWVVFEGAAIWYVSAYAAKVRKNPSKSVVGVGAGKLHVTMDAPVAFTPRRKVILAIFGLTFAVMTYGVIPFGEMGLPLPELGWWFPELSALFLVGGVVIGLIDHMKEEEIVETFVAGCADLLGVALIIGISRGITVLMNDGGITDTILHWGEQALSGTGSISFVLLVYLIYLPLTVLIPSSSGLATLSVPVMAPLGRFAGVGGELVVTAFQSACGLVNIITPTAAVVMGALALGKVPYDRWVKYVWKLMLYFFLLNMLFLIAGVLLG